MELTEEVKALLLNTAKERKRQRTAGVHGADGASLGPRWEASGRTGVGLESWDDAQRDATPVERGMVCVDAFSSRGRKRSEDHLPNLLNDITAIVDNQSQADPQFRTRRLYTRLTAAEVRRQLMAQKG
jgi:hypothetical protein